MSGTNEPADVITNSSLDRVRRIFEFLRALEERKNPVPLLLSDHKWHFSLAHLPLHPQIRWFRGGQEHGSEIVYLKVARPNLTKAPTPPEALREWLSPSWEKWGEKLEYLESRTLPREDGEATEIRFDESDDRVIAYLDYEVDRDKWIKAEEQARLTNNVYEKLFELWGQLRRDSESLELVIANAVLSLKTPEATVQHPLLLASVQLVFDSQIPEFRIIDAGAPSEFYQMLFRRLPEWAGCLQGDIRAEFEKQPVHPFDSLDEVAAWSEKTIHFLDKNGTAGETLPESPNDTPQITGHPYLLLRSRGQGYAAVLDAIVREVGSGIQTLSPALLSILGLGDDAKSDSTTLESQVFAGSTPHEVDPLFCLPANPQQEKVAHAIGRQSGVVVQGPPGTGKTHTIANLVGHFLAQGKSVLVTSHTSKALRVLRDKIPEDIRSLCVSVLDDDSKSREELKFAINKIVGNLSHGPRWDPPAVERCRAARDATVRELAAARNELKLARADEYRPITIAGSEISPAVAAREVAQGAGEHAWIRGPLTPGAPLPLSNHQLRELYSTNSLGPEAEAELEHWLPSSDTLPTPEHFVSTCKKFEEISDLLQPSGNFWPLQEQDLWDLDELRKLIESATAALSPGEDRWLIRVIDDSQDDLSLKPWTRLVDSVRSFIQSCLAFRETELSLGPALSTDDDLETQLQTLEQIEGYLEQGKSLDGFITGLLHRKWTTYVQNLTVNDCRPTSKAHITALKEKAHLLREQQILASRWQRQVTVIGGPDPDSFRGSPESAYKQWVEDIESALRWRDKHWEPLERKMRDLGICWSDCLGRVKPVLEECGSLIRIGIALRDHLLPEVDSRVRSLQSVELNQELTEVANRLIEKSAGRPHAKIIDALVSSLRRREPQSYRQEYQVLVGLEQKRAAYETRQELLAILGVVAPSWASDIRGRVGVHGATDLQGDVEAAWLWRQYFEELERRSKRSLSELQNQASLKRKEAEHATTELINITAWTLQLQRMLRRPDATRALHIWMDVLRGASGNGQRAKFLRSEVRKQMSQCRESVPVWIMPLARLVQNFNPCESRFDVVIIDESSQSDLMALMAAYMAEKVVVVGDDEQVSPDGVGDQLAGIQELIDTYLTDVPGGKLFDRKYSLYDLAKANFGSPIRLREHFRCAPEIIQFSNALSYDFEIQALRDMSNCSIRPHLVPYKVEGVRENGKINRAEAEAIASLISAMCEMPEYAGASIGVISLLADEQARHVEKLLGQRIPTEEFERRRIVCGNASQFQGDQRSIMFLSMVDSPGDGPEKLRSAGANDMYKKRFNVAASRAEDQMWVVYSLSPETDLKPEDLRKRLIDHALNPAALLDRVNNQSKRVESEFERQVLTRLVAAGFRVTSQWPVGSYRIDLVVEGSGKRLAVECDGDRYHGAEQLDHDIERQQLLERLGWTFARIRGAEYFRNPEAAMRPVLAKLAELGIAATFEADLHPQQSDPIRDRVIRRAAEIRTQWNELDNNSGTDATKVVSGAIDEPIPSETMGDVEEDSELEPVRRKINEVSSGEIRAAVRESLRRGACHRDDLFHAVKLQLGFQRLRDRIKTRITAAIALEMRQGNIRRIDDCLELCPGNFPQPQTQHELVN